MSYYCNFCIYKTDDSGNFYRHKKTKKHILLSNQKATNDVISNERLEEISNKLLDVENNLASISKKIIKENFICQICKTEFKHNSSLSRHRKYCLKKDEDDRIKKIKFEFNGSKRF